MNLLGLSLAWMGGGDGWVVCVGGVRGGGASETGARAIAMPSYREPQQPSAHASTAAHRLATTEVISCVGARACAWRVDKKQAFCFFCEGHCFFVCFAFVPISPTARLSPWFTSLSLRWLHPPFYSASNPAARLNCSSTTNVMTD